MWQETRKGGGRGGGKGYGEWEMPGAFMFNLFLPIYVSIYLYVDNYLFPPSLCLSIYVCLSLSFSLSRISAFSRKQDVIKRNLGCRPASFYGPLSIHIHNNKTRLPERERRKKRLSGLERVTTPCSDRHDHLTLSLYKSEHKEFLCTCFAVQLTVKCFCIHTVLRTNAGELMWLFFVGGIESLRRSW